MLLPFTLVAAGNAKPIMPSNLFDAVPFSHVQPRNLKFGKENDPTFTVSLASMPFTLALPYPILANMVPPMNVLEVFDANLVCLLHASSLHDVDGITRSGDPVSKRKLKDCGGVPILAIP